MTFERLPWFQCYPTKLLGALAGLEPDEGYIYVIILLRIYEMGGPVAEDAGTLARRSGLSRRRAEAALKALLDTGKLITAEGLISNPQAEKIMTDQSEKQIGRKNKAKTAADSRWQKTKQNHRIDDPQALLGDAMVDREIEQKKNYKKKTGSRADRATRIPADWALTPEMGNYGRSRGLTHREVLNEAEKFVRYWRSKGGERARKVDWKSTWENWCIGAAERLSRVPRDVDGIDAKPSPDRFDRRTWETIATMYESTSNWQRSWGPEPGPNCQMPPDLLKKFVNSELTLG